MTSLWVRVYLGRLPGLFALSIFYICSFCWILLYCHNFSCYKIYLEKVKFNVRSISNLVPCNWALSLRVWRRAKLYLYLYSVIITQLRLFMWLLLLTIDCSVYRSIKRHLYDMGFNIARCRLKAGSRMSPILAMTIVSDYSWARKILCEFSPWIWLPKMTRRPSATYEKPGLTATYSGPKTILSHDKGFLTMRAWCDNQHLFVLSPRQAAVCGSCYPEIRDCRCWWNIDDTRDHKTYWFVESKYVLWLYFKFQRKDKKQWTMNKTKNFVYRKIYWFKTSKFCTPHFQFYCWKVNKSHVPLRTMACKAVHMPFCRPARMARPAREQKVNFCICYIRTSYDNSWIY